MRKGVVFRIYPNKEQTNFINQTLGCCRLIYNRGLVMREEAFSNGQNVGYNQTSAMLTELKTQDGFAFLSDVDSMALQQSLRDLDRAYVNFFQNRAGHPRFKSKRDGFQSYRTINSKRLNQQGQYPIHISGNYIKLPKLGYVKIRQSMEVGYIHNVTVKRTPTGKYFAVLNVDCEDAPRLNNGCVIGIDVGIKEFYTDSNGRSVPNPKWLQQSMRKLKREQHRLSRMMEANIAGYRKGPKGGRVPVFKKPLSECSNIQKQKHKIALIHEKITNQRNDFLHKQSVMLIRENQTICMEDLNIKGMVRNHKLAQAISSVSWGKFFAMLEYKAVWYGNDIIRVPTMYPSSQTCSCCGYKNPLVKNLAVRFWECPNCHSQHDRDQNAAINIRNKGLAMASA